MIRTTHTLNRLAQAVAAAIAIAVLIVPAGLAGTSARYGAHDPWFNNAVSRAQLNAPDPWFNYAVSLSTRSNTANHSGYRFTTDTLGGNGQPKATSGYRFITDTLAPGASNLPAPAPVSTGFDWGDAGVGAATLGLALLLLTSGLLVLRRRGRLAF